MKPKLPKLKDKCLKVARTANLYQSFFALGLCMTVPGPTLLDLQHIVNTDTQHIAIIYTVRSTGYLLGSVFGGILFDCLPLKQPLLIGCNLILAITTLASPWSRDLITLLAIMAACGISMGAVDTGGSVWCLSMWGKDSAPYFQALHFMFGVGSFFAPLIAEPFLESIQNNENSTDSGRIFSNLSENSLRMLNTSTEDGNFTLNINNPDGYLPTVTYAYVIMGGYSLLVTLFFIVCFIIAPQEQNADQEDETTQVKDHGLAFTLAVTALSTLLIGIYTGIEIGYGQMLATFAVKGKLKLSKSTGSFLTSVYWGTFTFTRGVGIVLSAKLKPVYLMIGDLVLVVAAGFILVFGADKDVMYLWVGTAILGVGTSSFYPAVVALVERYILISSKVAATFSIASSLGEMVIPITVSSFIDSKPDILLYVVLGFGILTCGLSSILWFILNKKGEKYSTENATNVSTNVETIS